MLSISGAFVGTHSPKSCFWCCRPVRYKKVHGSCWVDFHGPTSFTFLVCFTERTGSRNCKPGINNRQQMCFLFIQNSKKWPDNEQVRGVYSVKTLVRLGCTFRHDRWPEVNGRKWSLLGFSHHPACSPLVITVGGPERFDQLRFKTNAFLRRTNDITLQTITLLTNAARLSLCFILLSPRTDLTQFHRSPQLLKIRLKQPIK